MGNQGEDSLQDRGFSCNWMPNTPYRRILPKPQPPPPEILAASETLDFGVEGTEQNRVAISFSSPDREEESGFVYRRGGDGGGTSAESHYDHMAPWKGIPCTELLALANVAAGNPLLHENGNGSAVLGETQHECPLPGDRPDLEFSLANSYGQFSPITPEKSKLVDREEQWVANSATINMEQKKGLAESALESPPATLSTQLQENYNPDKALNNTIDLNKTPQLKQRRRKHRPKVIREGQPKTNPKPPGSRENPTIKRKYVRKNAPNKNVTPPPPQENGEQTDSNKLKSTKRSCTRALNFGIEEQREGSSSCRSLNMGSQSEKQNFYTNGIQSNSTVPPKNGVEMIADNTEAAVAHELVSSSNQMLKEYLSLPEQQAPSTPYPTRSSSIRYIASVKEDSIKGRGQAGAHLEQVNPELIMLDCDTQSSPQSSHEEHAKSPKRKYYNAVEQADPMARNLIGAHYNNYQAYYNLLSWMHFPYIFKKKRTDKAHNSTIPSTSYRVTMAENAWRSSTASYLNSCPQFNTSSVPPVLGEAGKAPHDKLPDVESFLPLCQTERSTKRRSKGPTRVRDFASLTRTPEHILHRAYLAKQPPGDDNGQRVEHYVRTQTCIDALVTDVGATMAKKKRTKRNPLSTSQRSLVIYKNQQYFTSGAPPQITFDQFLSAITEHFKCLDINRESSRFAYQGCNAISTYKTQNQEHNALVLYRRDGTAVPFDGPFDPIKKRRTRPKVDLDQETDRVWKLLMDNINSEGIDGTDEEKAKWWEEERRVFQGRADSFIARMHLVQGDRRFSPWKGSVVDSVVGVFLTQNVSDHLSSSAFMSLAAHFPLHSRRNEDACSEEVASLVVDEPEVCIGEISNQTACDWSSITFHETDHSEEKVVNGNENSESTTTEGVISTNESERKLSRSSEPGLMSRSTTKGTRTVSHCSIEDMKTAYDVVSSQNLVDSSTSQTVEKTASCGSNSETEDPPRCENSSLDHSTSFLELLQKAESTMLHQLDRRSSHMSSHGTSNCESYQPACVQHNDQRHDINRQRASREPSDNCCSHLTPNPGVLQVECFDLFREVTQSSNISKNKCEDSLSERSVLTTDSASPDTIQNELIMNVQEAPSCSGKSCNNIQVVNNMVQQSCLNISEETIEVIQKAERPDSHVQGRSISKELSKTDASTSKTKSRRAGKEKKDPPDWDKLRKQAEPNGKKRGKTANTMDSLDWEAVRCADVKEIAQTIKERGMNNMLAERIKDFLNRLVREHGSVNLEWLRDVPPDQAKEYLLSFRGLGLKSVECVRLLTLHHLAFPVDTNVGRIAVRLGWVPLQPLPESLQLHLLELYPVLESIQKYLWPRLCKLDQRTLYELHYQMITFGKVFCTKSKPNCNACPMRGECRHFASAFASARLALPGPEERSIVSATEIKNTYTNPVGMNNRMPLPPPHPTKLLEGCQQMEGNQQSEEKSEFGKSEPIIEVPATPEPDCTETVEDIEDFCDDPEEIPTIKLNMEEFTQNLQNYMQENMELQEGEMSKALVSLTSYAASIPTPKLKNVSRLRTEHQVYEVPDTHPLLEMLQLDKREPDDPCSYMLAIWTPGETPNSIQPPENRCSSQELGRLCDDKECFSCNSAREANSQTVRGTLLIPCRTAMRGSFPLNGTYFQVNEVFADHDSSLNPIDVPRAWLWKLNRRTVYFGTSIPTIFKGLTTQEIQQCFWRGYVCVRGFDQKTRGPRPLMARLHFPASKLSRTNNKRDE